MVGWFKFDAVKKQTFIKHLKIKKMKKFKMKNLMFVSALLALVVFTSCKKEAVESNLASEIGAETHQIMLNEAGFERIVTSPLNTAYDEDYYSSGVIEYRLDGEVLATVDFGAGDTEEDAALFQNGKKTMIKKKKGTKGIKGKKGKKGKKDDYKKVIVDPIVKTNNCAYIVSGIIKYYDIDNGDWLATVDFGDGTCDTLATKYYPVNGGIDSTTFHVGLY